MLLDLQTLDAILARLPELSIAVVGDVFLDKYLDLDATLTEVSIETGLEAFQVTGVRCYPGAGGTVLNNLHALGVGDLHAVSVIGQDGEGFELLCELDRMQVHTEHLLQSPLRMTPTYTKPMLRAPDAEPRELNRLDIRNRSPQGPEIDRQVMAALDEVVPQVDAVVIADQVTERNHGVVTDVVREHLSELAREHAGKLFLADSRAHLALFRNCIIKPNRSELYHALGLPCSKEHFDPHATLAAVKRLALHTGQAVYATCGEEGIIYSDGAVLEEIPAIPVKGPIDIVGAGDSTAAGILCGLCAGVSPVQAAELGCLVASITIQQLGVTGTATPAQLRSHFANLV